MYLHLVLSKQKNLGSTFHFWLVGWFWCKFEPIFQSISSCIPEREQKERCDRREKYILTKAYAASLVGPYLTIIQIGRPPQH